MEKNREIQSISIEEIKPAPNKARRALNEEADESLTRSIEKYGVLNPPLGEKLNDGTTILLTGSRRYKASKAARLKTIPVIIVSRNEDSASFSLIENIHREDLPPLDKARAVQELRDHQGYNLKELADILCINDSTVSQLMAIAKMDPEVKEAIPICKEELNFSQLREISRLGTKEEQLELINKVAKGKIPATTRAIFKEVEKMSQGHSYDDQKGGEISISDRANHKIILSIKKAFSKLEKLIKENEEAIRDEFLEEFKRRVEDLTEIIEATHRDTSDMVINEKGLSMGQM